MATAPAVQIRVDRVYGNITMYPACAMAQVFAEIAGKKTLSMEDLKRIQSLGFEVKIASESAAVLNDQLNKMLQAVAS